MDPRGCSNHCTYHRVCYLCSSYSLLSSAGSSGCESAPHASCYIIFINQTTFSVMPRWWIDNSGLQCYIYTPHSASHLYWAVVWHIHTEALMCDQIYEVCECDYVECEWFVRMSGDCTGWRDRIL